MRNNDHLRGKTADSHLSMSMHNALASHFFNQLHEVKKKQQNEERSQMMGGAGAKSANSLVGEAEENNFFNDSTI